MRLALNYSYILYKVQKILSILLSRYIQYQNISRTIIYPSLLLLIINAPSCPAWTTTKVSYLVSLFQTLCTIVYWPQGLFSTQPWIFIGRTVAGAEASILWPPDAKNWLIGKDTDAGKYWGQEEKRVVEDEMVRKHNWSQWTWIWAGSGRQQRKELGRLQPMGSQKPHTTQGLKSYNYSQQKNYNYPFKNPDHISSLLKTFQWLPTSVKVNVIMLTRRLQRPLLVLWLLPLTLTFAFFFL